MSGISLRCLNCGYSFNNDHCNSCNRSGTVQLCNNQVAKCTSCSSTWTWCICMNCGAYVSIGLSQSTCFLTTACCEYLGKNDNCEELTILRKFRDEFMKPDEKMAMDIQHYYSVAPLLINEFEKSKNKAEIYKSIYNDLVLNCVNLIKNGKLTEAYEHYKAYVESLCKTYSI